MSNIHDPTKEKDNALTIIMMIILLLLNAVSFYSAILITDGMTEKNIKDFGKTRINDEIYSCEHIPKASTGAVHVSLEEFIEGRE